MELQQQGNTAIIRINGGKMGLSGQNAELNWKFAKINQASALRVLAIHYCYSSEAWREQQALSKTAMSEPQQVRLRMHIGKA